MDAKNRKQLFDNIKTDMKNANYVYNPLFSIVAATYLTRNWAGDPLWLISVAPPGAGKSCTLNQFWALTDVETVSSITPAGLITCFDLHGEDPSLFAKLDGKLLLAKDFGSIMTLRYDDMKDIFMMFREAFDGHVEKKFAHILRSYDLRFNFIAASTEAADQHRTLNQQLGERFLRFQAPVSQVQWPSPEVNDGLKNNVKDWMDELERSNDIPKSIDVQWIAEEAETTARLRTELVHFGTTSEILDIPRFEHPTRLCKQFDKLYKGLIAITGDEEFARKTTQEAARNCISKRRINVLKLLNKKPGLNGSEICRELYLGRRVIRELLGDLVAIGVLIKEHPKDFPNEYKYVVSPEYTARCNNFIF